MLLRKLEPEVMDDPGESQAYDAMDHESVNRIFVDDFLGIGPSGAEVLDLGTGTARIPIHLCQRTEEPRVVASDAAKSMLDIAKVNVAMEGLEHRIVVHFGNSKQLDFPDNMFDSVISNSLLHHLPVPLEALGEMVRVVRRGGRIFVRDLLRPDSADQVESLVAKHADGESAECRQLFRQSLEAALTEAELRDMVEGLGFERESVQTTSDRHLTWAATKPPTAN